MQTSTYQHDWTMDSYSHKFPSVPGGTNSEVVKILEWLKEYDEQCLTARAQMFKKINELLGNKELEK